MGRINVFSTIDRCFPRCFLFPLLIDVYFLLMLLCAPPVLIHYLVFINIGYSLCNPGFRHWISLSPAGESADTFVAPVTFAVATRYRSASAPVSVGGNCNLCLETAINVRC